MLFSNLIKQGVSIITWQWCQVKIFSETDWWFSKKALTTWQHWQLTQTHQPTLVDKKFLTLSVDRDCERHERDCILHHDCAGLWRAERGDVSWAVITSELSGWDLRPGPETQGCWPDINQPPPTPALRDAHVQTFLAPCWSVRPISRLLLVVRAVSMHQHTTSIEGMRDTLRKIIRII